MKQTLDYSVATTNFQSITNSAPSLPGRLRIQDINSDGFPDLTVTASFIDTTSNAASVITSTNLFLNNAGYKNETIAFKAVTDPQILSDNPDASTYQTLTSTAGNTGELVTFMDIDEDGKLDFLIQKIDTATKKPILVMLYNFVNSDSFFIKALTVNS